MVADRLAERHFSAQADASGLLDTVDIARLDAFLRVLLFTDGTVSRTLEACTLHTVEVEQVEQAQACAPALQARHLEVAQDQACTRRRIVMRLAGTHPSVWAESFVAPERLPARFLKDLAGNSQGIGGSLQELKLESWRELLWFGLGSPPSWPAPAPPIRTVTRFYRIIVEGRPALVISEHFAAEARNGLYHLIGAP